MARTDIAERERAQPSAADGWVAAFRADEGRLDVRSAPDGAPGVSRSEHCTVLFDGFLFEPEELARKVGEEPDRLEAAALVRRAYEAFGDALMAHVHGLFALVIWDERAQTLLCARDPHGLHPFFYAEANGTLFLSPSIPALLDQPGVSRRPNAGTLADHICHRWPFVDETYFEAVERLPGGCILRARNGTRTTSRYWDPVPPGRPIEWIGEAELEEFGFLLDRAVTRCLSVGQVGIFLSGGLDSISVAAIARDAGDRLGLPPPLALSLVFEHPDSNEEHLQRAAAAQLGLEQFIVTVSEAVAPEGLIRLAVEMTADFPAPLLNLWNPAYAYLARHGKAAGVKGILTGNGGDEWVDLGVHHSGRAIKELDFRTLYQVWTSMQRHHRFTFPEMVRNMGWTYGLRPLARNALAAGLMRGAPGLLDRIQRARFSEVTPAWIAPNPRFREEVYQRYVRTSRQEHRGAIGSAIVAHEMEEFHETGRQFGAPLLHPFWDPDVTWFLARTPARLLIRSNRSKGLIRESLTRRFPDLGFDRQRKVNATDFFRTTLVEQGVTEWRRLGGARALADLGVVDPRALDTAMTRIFAGGTPQNAHQIWYVLSLEGWARAHA